MNKTLRSISLFKECENAFFQKLEESAQNQNCKKGKILFIHGEAASRFYVIKSGWVKLFRETLDGTQAVINILPAGHMFGETAIFAGDVYTYSAEAIEKSEVISLPLPELKSEIEKNNKLALAMLNAMAQERRAQDKEIEHRSIQNASQRIGCFLLRLINQDEQGAASLRLPYDKTMIASLLGMQPETFSRALSRLHDKTGLTVKGSKIEINDLSRLVRYCCTSCSSEFPCKDLQTVDAGNAA